MPLSSKERILAAINHEQPDRIPLVIGVSNATGIKMRTYQQIKQIAGIQAPDRYIYDWPELGTAEIDEQTMQRLHSDYVDSWGSGQIELGPDDWFPSVHPMPNATTIEETDAYPGWPDMSDPTRIAHVQAQAKRLAEENEYAILATPWLLFPFERAFAMQGMETFLLNMALYRDFAKALMQRIVLHCKQLMGPFLDELADNVDVIKSRTKAKMLFHSDGDVVPLIDDLVEMGVDILNPIQTSAGTMSEVRRVMQILGPGGGCMIGAVHTIMNDVPAKNVLAMVDAVEEFGYYPIH